MCHIKQIGQFILLILGCVVCASNYVNGTPSPTSINYVLLPSPSITPTNTPVSITNSVAFIVGDWQNHGADSLWIANLDGSAERKILDEVNQVGSKESDLAPLVVWSPNGQWLAVTRKQGIWIVSPDGKNLHEVVTFGGEVAAITHLEWLPDSKKIVFEVYDGLPGIHTGTFSVVDIITGRVYQIAEGAVNSISPDGQWIAFVTLPYALKTVNITDGRIIDLNYGKFCRGVGIGGIFWSPKSDRLAIWEFGNGQSAHGTVCMVTLNGEGAMLTTEGVSSHPAWSPDGKGLYIGVVNYMADTIYDINHDTSGLFYFGNMGQFIKNLGYSHEIGRGLETLLRSPNGQWLLSNRQVSGKEREFFHFINLVDNSLLTYTVKIFGELVADEDFYYWTNDNQNLVFVMGEYNTPDGVGLRHYGSIYGLDIQTGKLTRLTNNYWIKSQVVSPDID